MSTTSPTAAAPPPSSSPRLDDDVDKEWHQNQTKEKQKWERRLIRLPFAIGILWAFLHPTASILTGDFFKCRGFYVDENSLETSNLRSDYRYLSRSRSSSGRRSDAANDNNVTNAMMSLCDALMSATTKTSIVVAEGKMSNMDCYRYNTNSAATGSSSSQKPSFDLARIVATGNTLEPSNEAIAIVTSSPPPFKDWSTSLFHAALLELLQRLASSQQTPWLAKTIFLIAPSSSSTTDPQQQQQSLHGVVDVFLSSYLGDYYSDSSSSSSTGEGVEALPPQLSDAMIRNLLVVDTLPFDDSQRLPKNEIRILSQGNRGVLPNMDLTFMTMSVFSRGSAAGNTGGRRSSDTTPTTAPTVLMHSFGDQKRQWEEFVNNQLLFVGDSSTFLRPMKLSLQKWAIQLGNLALFAFNLFGGPYAPHSLALDRGIDAVTIEGRYLTDTDTTKNSSDNSSSRNFIADYVSKLEITLRGLSNLHERLHHSTTLYLLPSPKTFVKHEEYLIPNLLLLIPAVLRAAFLGLRDISRFDLGIMGSLVGITVMATLWMDAFVAQQDDVGHRNAWWSLTYAACFGALYYQVVVVGRRRRRDGSSSKPPQDDWDPAGSSKSNALKNAQLVTCLATIYLHVPICFGHVSLSYPSACFWTPWVAFPSFEYLNNNNNKFGWFKNVFGWLIMVSWLILSWPPVAILPAVFFDSCTPYVRFVYFPLHLLLSLSCLLATFNI